MAKKRKNNSMQPGSSKIKKQRTMSSQDLPNEAPAVNIDESSVRIVTDLIEDILNEVFISTTVSDVRSVEPISGVKPKKTECKRYLARKQRGWRRRADERLPRNLVTATVKRKKKIYEAESIRSSQKVVKAPGVYQFPVNKRGEKAFECKGGKLPLVAEDIVAVAEAAYHGDSNSPLIPLWLKGNISNVEKTVMILLPQTQPEDEKRIFSSNIKKKLKKFALLREPEHLLRQICTTALVIATAEELAEEFESVHYGRRRLLSPVDSLRTIYRIREAISPSVLPEGNVISRVDLVLSLSELLAANYATPLTRSEFRQLYEYYAEPTVSSPLAGMDGENPLRMYRLAIVTENEENFWDEFIWDDSRSDEILKKRFPDAEEKLPTMKTKDEAIDIMPQYIKRDCIVVGHNLQADLEGTQLCYPFQINTEQRFNLTIDRRDRQSLVKLCDAYAPEEMPDHLPRNDAHAALALVQLKLQKGFHYGNEFLESTGRDVNNGEVLIVGHSEQLKKYDSVMNEMYTSGTESVQFENISCVEDIKDKIVDDKHFVVIDISSGVTDSVSQLNEVITHLWNSSARNTVMIFVVPNRDRSNDIVMFGTKSGSSASVIFPSSTQESEGRNDTAEDEHTEDVSILGDGFASDADRQQVYPNQQPGGQMYPGGPPPPESMPPPDSAQRRHPDFDKGQQPPYPPYSQQRPPMYGDWSNNNSQYRAQFPTPPGSAPGVNQGTQQWTPRTVGPPNSQQMGSQWGQPNQQTEQQSTAALDLFQLLNEFCHSLEVMLNVDLASPSEIETETASCAKENDSESTSDLRITDPAGTLKRRRMSDYEDECFTRDDTQDSVARRCVCLSNILRNLTFVPGNELEFTKNATFLALLGKLLLLHHEHPARTQKQRNDDTEEDADFADSCSSLQGESEWWWDFLHHIRENVLVMAANISGHMDLGQYPEEISRPVLDGLLHWAVCPAAHGQDPFTTVGTNSWLSPQRLALEALCKLCVTDSNVDLVIATPPHSRLERLCAVLTRLLCRSKEQVLRELAVNLLHYLAAADSSMARTVALQSPCVSLLVAFIEQAESSALEAASQHGIGALRENPDSMGTSLDMLRRAAGTLLHLAMHPGNRQLFLQQEQRLLALVMSRTLDEQVVSIIASVLFHCSRPQEDFYSNNSSD